MKHLFPLLIALFALSAQAQTFKFSVKGTIVEEGTTFGLTIYDRIVLNAEAVKEDQVIY